jgi:phosphopantetheinyl transferase
MIKRNIYSSSSFLKNRLRKNYKFPFKSNLKIASITESEFLNLLINSNFKNILLKEFKIEEKISYDILRMKLNFLLKRKLISNLLIRIATHELIKSNMNYNIEFSQLIIKRNNLGKPFVELSDNFHIKKKIFISVSHKDGIYIAAAGFENLGVDIDRIQDFKLNFLEKVFNKSEINNALQITESILGEKINISLNIAFTSLYSIKEAISKIVGLGLKMNFKKIHIEKNDSQIKIYDILTKRSYIASLYLKGNYIYSLIEVI